MKTTYPSIKPIILILLLALAGCSVEKNNRVSRFYQGFTTRYNVFFNGKENYDKAFNAQLRSTEENTTALLPVHPISLSNGKTNNDYNRTIEKCQKAIKTHSIKTKKEFNGARSGPDYQAWLNEEEYNPFLHKAWLLMARAQFYKGDFEASQATFNYIIRHFRNLPNTVAEANIWKARCLAEEGQLYETEDILRKINKAGINPAYSGIYQLVMADLLLKQKENSAAIPFLEKAIQVEKNKTQRYRLNFLLGQLYAETGEREKAFRAFEKVIKLSPPYEIEFSAQIKQTENMIGQNSIAILRKLSAMAKKSKYKSNADQLYYAMGNVYLTEKDTTNALKNYILAIEKSDKNVNQKALAQVKAGDLFFIQKKYPEAQPCYGGALGVLPKTHAEYDRISKRSEALDELIIHYQNVQLQDSLLALSAMSVEDQLKVANLIIDNIVKKEKAEKEAEEREKLKAESQAQNEMFNDNFDDNPRIAQKTAAISNDKSWYFYNTSAVSKGKAEFQSRWGSRKLEDNWRRRNKNSFTFAESNKETTGEQATGNANNQNQTGSDKDSTLSEKKIVSDPKDPNFYLQQIPSNDEARQTSLDIVRDGLYNMALVYKNRLQDFNLAESTFKELSRRFPQTPNLPDMYYNMYMIGQQKPDNNMSELYKNKLISEFPKSEYALALSDPDYVNNYLKKRREVEDLYQQTYLAYLKNDTSSVRQAYQKALKDFPMSKLNAKFAFLNALVYINQKNNKGFKKALQELLEKYPNTDVTELAGSMMTGLALGKEISGEKVNTDIWSKRVVAAEVKEQTIVTEAEFTIDPISPHFVLFAYPTDSTYNNRLMYDVAAFNFSNFAIRDFDFDMFPLQGIGLLRVKGFATFSEVLIYKERLFGPKGIGHKLPAQLKTVLISEKNFNSLMKGRTFAEYFEFYNKNLDKKQDK